MVWNTILLGGGVGVGKRIHQIIQYLEYKKRVIRSIIGVNSRASCKQLFKETQILTLVSIYVSVGSDMFYDILLSIPGAELYCS